MDALELRDALGESPLIVGRSAAVQRLRRQLERAARVDSTVLLTGETGTGKGLVARILHTRSQRTGRFVHVDCTALASGLIESELFGHERGAFTGAQEARAGRFECAARGTVFLDEIGELPRAQQPKLLRVLEDRRFERVGGTRTLAMTARVVAATNRDLSHGVAQGSFRSDLWYRLRVIEIALPPLRERPDDIPVLVEHACARGAGPPPPAIARAFWRSLASHSWPGNVRELLHGVERLLVAAPGEAWHEAHARIVIGASSAASVHAAPPQESDERRRIAAALVESGGNVSRAARRLSIPRGTLRHRIRRHGLIDLIPRD